MSLESVLDELIFVFGPLIATLLATQPVPVLVLYVAAGAGASPGRCGCRLQPATEPPVTRSTATVTRSRCARAAW